MNVIALILNCVSWLVLAIVIWRFYKKQDSKPVIWKMLIVILVGLFSFSINIPVMEHQMKLAILPLGVWIVFWVYSRRNDGRSWQRYRRFAWIGFFANYFFLIMSLLTIFIHEGMYPRNEISTYISDIHDASVIKTNPTGENVQLENESLLAQLKEASRQPVFSEIWYQETYVTGDSEEKKVERFPYQLVQVSPKTGSGITSIVFIERDGKGILISNGLEQYYFRLGASILKEEQ